MAILRKEKRGHYTVIDNTIFRDSALSNKALGLLCRMLSLPDGWEFSVRGLAALSTDGVDGVTSQLNELEKHGYLVRSQLRIKGKLAGVEYIVSETKMSEKPCAGLPYTENPYTVIPDTEKPDTENTPQYITKEYITKESNTKESKTNKSITKKSLSEEFEKLWAMYPRKQGGKDKTFGYYERARKNGTTYEEVEQGIRAYKEYLRLSGTGDKYIKMASTFFSQKGWQDDYSVAQPKTNPNVGWDEATQRGLRSIFGRN